MSSRFVVDLENNHHYIIVDTVTGYTYYTPAQDDANVICGMLNSKDDMLINQRNHIKFLTEKLTALGVTDIEPPKYCKNCKHSGMALDGDCWCELKDRTMGEFDYCTSWVSE